MSNLTTDTRGQHVPNSMMYEIGYHAKKADHRHQCFAEAVGQALYSTHTWLQHKLELKPNEYSILSVHRLMRYLRKDQLVPDIVDRIPIDDWPKCENPLVPKAVRARKKDDAYEDGFEFAQEMKPMTKWDVERQREREALVDIPQVNQSSSIPAK